MPIHKIFQENSLLIDSFLQKEKEGKLSKEDFINLFNILKIPKNINIEELEKNESFFNYYKSIDILKERTNTLSGECLKLQSDYQQKSSSEGMCVRCCNRLVKIRDAMITECDQYVWGLDQICSGAVMIAYWRRSGSC